MLPYRSFAAADTANIASFPVSLNGEVIDNVHSEYPLLVYKNITYLPMTWDYSVGLGLSAVYSDADGLTIKKTGVTSDLKQILTSNNDFTKSISVEMPNFNIVVNGKTIDNNAEDYPLLMYRGITYFPLTWHYVVDEFGWKSNYSDMTGLNVQSTEIVQNVVDDTNDSQPDKSDLDKDASDKPTSDKPDIGKLDSIEIGKLSQSVVKLYVETVNGEFSTGSGFFYASGKIATNYHVIENARSIDIEFNDGTYYEGDVLILGYDQEKDIAALQISKTDIGPIKLGSFSTLVQGQRIYTIGSPHGLMNTLSDGIISSIRDDVIQISAPISPGSSGGALINEYGEVVGITTAISEDGENLGFCVAIDDFINMKKDGQVAVNKVTDDVISSPSYVNSTVLTNTSFTISWENTGADYYVVWESINGGEWYESLNEYGENKWSWGQDYGIYYYSYSSGNTISIAVASVKDGVISDYSDVVSIHLPYLDSTNVEALLDSDHSYILMGNYGLEIEDYAVSIDDNEEFIYIYGYIDASNTYVYSDAINTNYTSVLEALSEVAATVSQRTGIESSFTLVYSGYDATYPSDFATNSIYNESVIFDYDQELWFIWFPYVEVSSEYLMNGLGYRFWYE